MNRTLSATRRALMAGLAAVALTAPALGPAHAQTTETYSAQAAATALHLSLFGTDLTLTDLSAAVDSSPVAIAEASAALTPLITTEALGVEQRAEGATSSGGAGSCTFGPLTDVPGVVDVHDAACPIVLATIADGNPGAEAVGAQLALDIGVSELLDTIGLTDPLDDATGTVLDGLGGLLSGLSGVDVVDDLLDDTVDTLAELVASTLHFATTVRVTVGPARVVAEATAEKVSARAVAQGARIDLFPATGEEVADGDGIIGDIAAGDALVSLILGESGGTTSYDRLTGAAAEPQTTNSVLRIRIGDGLPLVDDVLEPLLDEIGLADVLVAATGGVNNIPGLEEATISYEAGEIVIEGPGTIVLFEGTPLQSTIVLSAIDTSGGLSMTGPVISVLEGVEGGITLTTSSIAAGTDTAVLPATITGPTDARSLSATGANPLGALVGVLLMVGFLAMRRLRPTF